MLHSSLNCLIRQLLPLDRLRKISLINHVRIGLHNFEPRVGLCPLKWTLEQASRALI